MFKSRETAYEHAISDLGYSAEDEGVYFKIASNLRNEYWIKEINAETGEWD